MSPPTVLHRRSHRTRRGAVVALAAVLALVLLAVDAGAHPRQTSSTDATFVTCTGVVDGRPVVVTVFVLDESVMADAGLYAPAADPTVDAPELVAILEAEYDAGRLDGRGWLAPPDDGGGVGRVAPGAEVVVAAQLADVGTERIRHRQREGNRLLRATGAEVTAEGAGLITVDGAVGTLACESLRQRFDTMTTAPDSTVLRLGVGSISCDVTDVQGNRLELYGDGFGVDAWVTAPDGSETLSAFSHDDFNRGFTRRRLDQVLNVHDGVTGERLGEGRLTADVATAGSAVRLHERFIGGSARVTEQPVSFRGSVLLGPRTFDLATCAGAWHDVKVQLRDPATPRSPAG